MKYKKEKIKQRVEWLLKEIEKEFDKICEGRDLDTITFFSSLEAKIIGKVEKAFSGVIE